ncbi:hypothetical protein QOT17_025386 [Balamuthia mandrillaris]
MEAITALNSFHKKINKETEHYVRLMQKTLSTFFPHTQLSTPIIGSENSTSAGLSTSSSHTQHPTPITGSVDSTSNIASPFSTPTLMKVPCLLSRLPKFNLDKCEDPTTFHSKELEYLLHAHDYLVECWMQALIATLTGHGRF